MAGTSAAVAGWIPRSTTPLPGRSGTAVLPMWTTDEVRPPLADEAIDGVGDLPGAWIPGPHGQLLAQVGSDRGVGHRRECTERLPTAGRRIGGMTDRVPLIVDVDTGIDDSLALLYACASPEAELVAVTCVAGNVDARQVGLNTRAVLELAGRTDIEVALGREVPLVRTLETTPETHGPRGIGYAELPPPTRPLSDRHAVDVFIEEARRRPGEITLVTLGPLTNLAVAVLREPELPRLLRRVVIMGGSYRSPGNTAPTTEWNISVDPDAAKVVLTAFGGGAGIPRPIALGLDVTERSKFTPEHMVRLARRSGSRPDDSMVDSGSPAGLRRHGHGTPVGRVESRHPVHRRCVALLHGVPQPV